MLQRYELTDLEWEQIAPLIPRDKTVKPGSPAKQNCQMLNTMVWNACSGAP